MSKAHRLGKLAYLGPAPRQERKAKAHADMPTCDAAPWIYWEVTRRQMTCRRCGASAPFGVKGNGPAYACAYVAFVTVFEDKHKECQREGKET